MNGSNLSLAEGNSVGKVMRQVIYALLPGTVALVLWSGWGVLVNILLSVTMAVMFEMITLQVLGRNWRKGLADYSAVVTALLLAIALPPLVPAWLIAVAIFFAIVVAKHLYGGLGYNPFNPAMVGYAVALVSFPREMSQWSASGYLSAQHFDLMAALNWSLTGVLPATLNFDALSSATPLDHLRTGLMQQQVISMINTSGIYGYVAGKGLEWGSAGFLLGGIWLLWRRIIGWQIPVAMLVSLSTMAWLFNLLDAERYAAPAFHLFAGAAMLGAFFIATDPVTASTTPTGKLLYGAGIGLLTYIIRTWGGYPDGVAFAVLLMSMAVPLIDYYTVPRAYGARR
jgi:electron transport complex protein RnfD